MSAGFLRGQVEEVEVEEGVRVELSEEGRRLLEAFERFCRRLGGVVRKVRTGWVSCVLPTRSTVRAQIYTGRGRRVDGWIWVWGPGEQGSVLNLGNFDMEWIHVTGLGDVRHVTGELNVEEGRHQFSINEGVKEIELVVAGRGASFTLHSKERV